MSPGCKGKCDGEDSYQGQAARKHNSKCSKCMISYDTDSNRCYCCNLLLRKRRSRNPTRKKISILAVKRY